MTALLEMARAGKPVTSVAPVGAGAPTAGAPGERFLRPARERAASGSRSRSAGRQRE